MKKIEMAKNLQNLAQNLDNEKVINGVYKITVLVNKPTILSKTPEQLIKRIDKEDLQTLINIFEKYQLGGN